MKWSMASVNYLVWFLNITSPNTFRSSLSTQNLFNNLYNGGLRRVRSFSHRSRIQAEVRFQQYLHAVFYAAVFGSFSLPETEAVGLSDWIAEP